VPLFGKLAGRAEREVLKFDFGGMFRDLSLADNDIERGLDRKGTFWFAKDL